MRLNYINQADLAVSFTYEGYQIGGLSGIDYDPKTDTYIAESDNGTNGKPPAIFKFQFTGLTNPDGTPKINIIGTPIPLKGVSNVESVRFDPNGNGFWVTTEESKPHIYHYDKNGVSTKLKVPTYTENGAQTDLNFKGATFAPDGSYFVSMERNLTNDPTGYSRILKYDKNRNLVGEYVYYTDRPSTVGATSNGISEILALDNTHLLVLERGFNANINEHANPNQSVNPVRIYKIDLSHAQNVIGQSSLSSAPPTVSKKLVFDSRNPSIAGKLATEANKIDNIEGMTLGPKLPNGHQSIVLVSDNNFNPIQAKTQFISLDIGDSLDYINQLDIPFGTAVNGHVIGGISGIDYNPATGTYLIETDHDPSGRSIVYEVRLNGLLSSNTKPELIINRTLTLQGHNQAESIRYDHHGNGFWITTEEKTAGIYHYDFNGKLLNQFHLPSWMNSRIQGNLGLEGSTFSPNGSYFTSLERNLNGDPSGYSRIIQFNPNGSIAHEYVYYTDRPSSIGAASNGISDILALDDTHLLVLERGHKSGVLGNQVRIYEIDLTNAQDVKNVQKLNPSANPAIHKTLIFDSNDLSIANKLNNSLTKIDNIEGMTLGPKLPNGHQTIILASDNNYNPQQLKTQFISLELDNDNTSLLKNAGMQKADEIHVKGSGNVITCSTGHNQIFGDVGHNEYVLNRAFNSISTYTEINHFDASKGDKLDLKKTLADTTFKNTTKDFTSLQKYISVTNQGSDVNIGISQYGDNHFTTIATLHNQNNPVDLGSLVKQGAISYS